MKGNKKGHFEEKAGYLLPKLGIEAQLDLAQRHGSILEDRADIPINAIHRQSGLQADLYPVREGDELRLSAFRRREQVDYGPPIRKVYIHSPEDLIRYKLMYFGLSQQSRHSSDIAAILK